VGLDDSRATWACHRGSVGGGMTDDEVFVVQIGRHADVVTRSHTHDPRLYVWLTPAAICRPASEPRDGLSRTPPSQ